MKARPASAEAAARWLAPAGSPAVTRNRSRRLCRFLLVACLLAAGVGAGCVRCPKTHISVDKLVAEYNANAQRIGRLKARAKIHLSFIDGKGRRVQWGSTSALASANGMLLLAKTDGPFGPKDFVLVGRETLAVELFRIGTSAAEGKYYLWFNYGDYGKAWWGWQKFAGAPQISEMPIDPNQIISVLAICRLPDKFTTLPTVLLRMSAKPCAYVLTYVARQAVTGRIVSTMDIYFRWADDRPRRPFMVKLFDATGQEVMTANLGKYATVQVPPADQPGPVMPTDIKISWPGRHSSAHIVLSELTTADTWDTDYCRFDAELPAGIGPEDITQIDSMLDTKDKTP